MSSSTPPLDSSSRVDDNSNSNSTSSETNNANPPDTSSATPLAPPPPSQETQISDAVPPPNNSSSSSNSSSNVAAAAPPQGLEENTQTPPTPNNSNSNSNLNNPPPPLPPQTSTPPSPVSTNIPNLGSPNPNPNSNSNSKTTPPPAIVSPTMPPPQAEKIMPVNPSPSQITPTNPSTPPPPPNQPTNQITSPVMQVLPNQTPPGLSPPQQANAQSLLPGVTPPPPPPFSSSIPSPLMHPSPNSAPVSNSFVTKSYEGVAPLFIVIGAVSVLVAILCVIGRKKKKQNDLVYYNEQHAKSDGVVYQHSYQYTATPPTDHMFGQPRTSTSSQTLSGNPTGSYKESYRAGYYPGMPTNNHTGAFSYEEITDMTGGFSCENLIGEGGFGCVYKGWVSDGRCVAVKQLKAGSGQGEREFQAEVEIISRIHHRHLVSLVGYCIVEHHRMLVYEFVPNSTLEHHLHGQPRIIHRDIKSANILLDYAFEAQVADFGLAKLSNDTYTHVSTRIMGTFGYLAPEYASSGKLTDRSDVFSFGVVLLELITGRKPIDANESLVEWARPLLVQALETHKTEELVDPRLENNYNRDDMFRMIEAAAACVRHSAPRRPRMVQVLRALESDLGHAVDLTNGIKVGQSMGFDPNQYPSSELQRFRQMAFSIEEEWSHEDGETPNRPFTRAVEPNFLIRDKSVK